MPSPPAPTAPSDEGRLAGWFIGLTVVGFVVLAAIARPHFETFDDAKYLGLGLNVLDGDGLRTIFGGVFISHSPVWPVVLAAPQAWFGIDGIAVGHGINALSGGAVIGMTGLLGWRVRPYAGALAAVALFCFPFLHDLARTAGIDLPAIALTLAFLLVGVWAIERDSVRLGLLAGALFAAAFLIKETVLPFAPLPLIAGLYRDIPLARLARVTSAMLFVAALGLSWWFALHAALGGVVYRLGAPAWTLGPISLVLAVVVVVGLSAGPIASWIERRGGRAAGLASLAAGQRVRLGWLLVLAWTAVLTFVFAGTAKLGGAALVRLDQLTHYAGTWGPALGLILGFAVAGGGLAIVGYRRLPRAQALVIADLLAATVCGIPLVLLVIGIGETPRHYVANLAVLVALGAAGWTWAIGEAGSGWLYGSILRERRRSTIALAVAVVAAGAIALAGIGIPFARQPLLVRATAAAGVGIAIAIVLIVASREGLRARARALAPRWGPALVLAAAALSGASTLGVAAVARTTGLDDAKAIAVDTAAGWLKEHVTPGTTIIYGSFLGYETALKLRDFADATRVLPGATVIDPAAAYGFRPAGGDSRDDWFAATAAGGNIDQVAALSATRVNTFIRRSGATIWAQAWVGTAPSPIVAALDAADGLHREAGWIFPAAGRGQIGFAIYRIDGPLAFDGRLYLERDALDRLVGGLERRRADARPAATRLLGSIVVVDDPEATAPLLARLRVLAGG
jgi:hypothetical protein